MFKNAYTKTVAFFKKQAKTILGLGAGVGLAITSSTPAHAVAMLDLSSATTAITAELSPAIAAGMPIFGTLLAVGVGIKFYKRFVH